MLECRRAEVPPGGTSDGEFELEFELKSISPESETEDMRRWLLARPANGTNDARLEGCEPPREVIVARDKSGAILCRLPSV